MLHSLTLLPWLCGECEEEELLSGGVLGLVERQAEQSDLVVAAVPEVGLQGVVPGLVRRAQAGQGDLVVIAV